MSPSGEYFLGWDENANVALGRQGEKPVRLLSAATEDLGHEVEMSDRGDLTFIYRDGEVSELAVPAELETAVDDSPLVLPMDINEDGTVVGFAKISGDDPKNVALRWDAGDNEATILDQADGAASMGVAVHDDGSADFDPSTSLELTVDAHGRIYGVDGRRPVVDAESKLKPLPLKRPDSADYFATRPVAVSDDGGVIIGSHEFTDEEEASDSFLWRCGG